MYYFSAPSLVSRSLVAATLIALSAGASAQQVIRIVGPDGKVTYADRMPNSVSMDEKANTANVFNGGNAQANLPYELKQIANRFPVTIYTGKNCGPCESVRSLLKNRGVPYTEKTVNSNEDISALERISGNNTLPFATIGQQQISGYSSAEWSRYIDAAGYPAKSQLPGNYQPAQPTPLVASTTAKPSDSSSATNATSNDTNTSTSRRRAVAPPTGPTVNRVSPKNPAGIQF